jgi:Ca2+-binding RTX toxin-like protein
MSRRRQVIARDRTMRLLGLAIAVALLGLVPVHPAIGATAVGYWRFEEGLPETTAAGPGSIVDASGSGDNGTPSGGPFYRADVPADQVPLTGAANGLSLEFDGVDDKVSFPSTFLFHRLMDATLEFWLKFQPLSHGSVFWTRPDSIDTDRFNIFVNGDSTIGFDYRGPSGELHPLVGICCTGIPVPRDTWTHVAITRTGNVYRLYVNGVLKATATDADPDLPTAAGWGISGREGFEFRGSVDEVRVSEGALRPAQFLDAGGQRCAGRAATIVGTPGPDALTGTPGDDVIVGLAGNDTIRGLGGNDTICGNSGDDLLHGGAGDDRSSGGDGNDAVYGDDGADRLFGNGGDDLLHAGPQNDRLNGGPGTDRCNGGLDTDTASNCEFVLFIETLVARRNIDGKANIYTAGRSVVPPDTDGMLPSIVALHGVKDVTFPSVSGLWSCCFGGFENGPDGGELQLIFQPCCGVGSYRGIGGIHDTSATDPAAGYLVGVFLDDSRPSAPAPAVLDFTDGHDFSELAPGVRQVFFIGNGRDAAGHLQRFHVPAGATRLSLGFADTCDPGDGPPSCYYDNTGGFTASLRMSL